MPFAKFLETQELLKSVEPSREQPPPAPERTGPAPLDLIALIPREAPILVTELLTRAGLDSGQGHQAIDRLVAAGLVQQLQVGDAEAVQLTEQGGQLLPAA